MLNIRWRLIVVTAATAPHTASANNIIHEIAESGPSAATAAAAATATEITRHG
jgi:hypothetical protein